MNILIADDEAEVAELIKSYVLKVCNRICPYEQNTAHVFEKGFGVIDYIENAVEPIDMIFLDIVFGEESGIRLAEEIQERNNQIKIVFVSGYAEYVERIFEVSPFYMLLKPTNEEKIQTVIEKAVQVIKEERGNYISLKNADGIHTVNLNDILYIKSERRYVRIVLAGLQDLKVIMTMAEVEEKMGTALIQSHRSYFVNIRRIKLLKKNSVVMMNEEELPVSAEKYGTIKQCFLKSLTD